MSTSPRADLSGTERPTTVRRLIVALTALMAFLLYLDRFCLSLPERYIKQDLGLNNDDIGWLFGAFFFAYAIGQVPTGWLSDRFGARLMLTLYILLWSLFTGWMGLALSFAMLLSLRLGCGLAQAGAYPTGASVIGKWALFSGRGLASAIVSVGGRIGGAAAPPLTGYLIIACVPATTPLLLEPSDLIDEEGITEAVQHPGTGGAAVLRQMLQQRLASPAEPGATGLRTNLNSLMADSNLFEGADLGDVAVETEGRRLAEIPPDQRNPQQALRLNRFLVEAAFPEQVRKYYGAGWRRVMVIYGLAGVLVAGLYWIGVRDRPREHPSCNSAEVEIIDKSRPAGTPDPEGKVNGLPIAALLQNRSLWFSSGAQLFTNVGWIFLVTWLPRYLDEVHKVPIVDRGWMAFAPIFVGMFGMFTGGWVTDWTTRRLGVRLGRMLPVTVTRFLAAAGFLSCLALQDPWAVTAALAFVAVTADLGTPATWAFCQDIGGRHAGSVLGWGNMWGNFGAMASPVLLNWVAKGSYSWNGVFAACALAFVISGLLSFGMNATVPLQTATRETA